EMQFKDLAEQLAGQSAEPLEGTILERQGKKEGRQINTFVLRTATRPPRTLYRKNLRTEAAPFLESEVRSRILDTIKQKLRQRDCRRETPPRPSPSDTSTPPRSS